MKHKVITLLVFFHFFFTLQAQKLSVNNLVNLYGQSIDDISANLLAKDWLYIGNNDGKYVWSYNKVNNLASAWLNVKSSTEPLNVFNNRVLIYKTGNVKHLSAIKSDLENLKYRKETYPYYNDEDICLRYTNNIYIFDLCISHIDSDNDSEISGDRNVLIVTVSKYLSSKERAKLKEENIRKDREKKEAVKLFLYNLHSKNIISGASFDTYENYVVQRRTVLRNSDNKDSKLILVLDSLTKVKLLSDSKVFGNYCLVLAKGKIGYLPRIELKKDVEIGPDYQEETQFSDNHINNSMCSKTLYKATIYTDLPEYRNIFSEPTYTDMSKVVISLPDKAIIDVIDELKKESLYYVVCYNGKIGYISKNIIIKND
jgi:hypothetical protein